MITLDFQRINDTALQQINTLLSQWFPHGRVKTHEFCVGSLSGEPGKRNGGSLRIHLKGNKAGVWKDFNSQEGGSDLISLYAAKFTNGDQGEAARQLAEQFNISPLKDYARPTFSNPAIAHKSTASVTPAEVQSRYKQLSDDPSHCTYFADKQVKAPADIRYGKDGLGHFAAMPLFNQHGELVNFERIYNQKIERVDTNKLSIKDAEKAGCYYPINYTPATVSNNATFHFCEGLCTGICIETGLNDPNQPIIVCSSLGNIKNVISHFRDKYPDHKFVIHADNDQWKPNKPNGGLENAREVAEDFNCSITMPDFDPDLKDDYLKRIKNLPTDWNDYFILNGADTLQDTFKSLPKPVKFGYGKLGVDLIRKKFEEPDWIVPGIFPQNSLNLVSAKPKDGKSWWALNVALAIAQGGIALGNQKFKCTQSVVLYLALEETEARLKLRLDQLLLAQYTTMPERFFYETKAKKVGDGFEKQIETWANEARAEHPNLPLLVIVDTLKKVKIAGNNKSLYDSDYESTEAFRELVEKLNIAIILIHHNNKLKFDNDADPLDAISGSSGLPASVDNNLIVKRIRGSEYGELYRVGRDFRDDSIVVIKFDKTTGVWTALDGDIEQYTLGNMRQQIVSSIREGATCLKDLTEMLDKPWETIQRTVNRMIHDNQLVRKKEGRSLKLSLPDQSNVTDVNHSNQEFSDNEPDIYTF
jgi:phage/plasmid primase-like uncharacterized protein